MKRPLDRVFYYHASASPIGGQLTHPVAKVIEHHASTSLPQAGGHAASRLDKLNINDMIKCEVAYSHTVGSVQKSTGNWATLVTSVVEGVNLFDIVTADRIVSNMALEHHRNGYYPKVSFVGSQFENLRVNGRIITADVNHQAVIHTTAPVASEWTSQQEIDRRTVEPHWQGFPDAPWPFVPTFTAWAQRQSAAILENPNTPQEIKNRFSWMTDAQKRKIRGYVLCSLVDGVQGAAPGTDYGHVINVPDLGNLFLGELVVDQLSFKHTALRVELGCQADGDVSFCTGSGNGIPMP